MPLFKFHGSINFCGVDETFAVEADNEWNALDGAYVYWEETVGINVESQGEITEEEADEEGIATI